MYLENKFAGASPNFHFQLKEGWRDNVQFCLRSALGSTLVY
jgi:hypothetical protein